MTQRDLSGLTATQGAVYTILVRHRYDGACRRTFALSDIWEVSNRISEIEQRLRIKVERGRCNKHDHRRPVTLYRL